MCVYENGVNLFLFFRDDEKTILKLTESKFVYIQSIYFQTNLAVETTRTPIANIEVP